MARSASKRSGRIARVDVVGVGLNATDTLIRLPHFPSFDTKVELLSADVRPGGQAASAMVACSRWGLRARYIGKVGDDAAAQFQSDQLARAGVEAHLLRVPKCSSQIAYILVDEGSGERTILWKRDPRLAMRPKDLKREWIVRARGLLVDGHDNAAAATAARWARDAGIPVVADIDNPYPGVQGLLEVVDYLMASRDFPTRLTGERDRLKAILQIARKFKCRVTGITLGWLGALAWNGNRFFYSRGFRVKAVDTTGAGDAFHGAFLYGVLLDWPVERILEFSCAAAALNCTALGAQGGIASVKEIEKLMATGERSEAAYDPAELKHREERLENRRRA
jgi:sulfofructose kinase